MKKYFLIITIFFILISSGCTKPGGGGSVGITNVPIEGGATPNAQELVIDETSFKVTKLTDKGCMIYWKTNVPATSCIEYGQSLNYNKTTAEDKNLVIEHNVELYSLLPRTRYYFRAVSSDIYNHLAQSQKEIYFDTFDQNFPPAAVTLSAPKNITYNSMDVSWTQSYESDFYKYVLYRDTTAAVSYMSPKIAEITTKMLTTYNDKNLSPNTTYYYLVHVLDTAELAAASNVVAGTTEILYNTLTKINLNTPAYKTTDSMVLSWNKCAESDFASYRVYFDDKPDVDTLDSMAVEITDANTTSCEIKNLTENKAYYFRLYLLNKGRVFTASDVATFKTYKNGELVKSINGLYYGNDVKTANGKIYVSAYGSLYVLDESTLLLRDTINIEGKNDKIRKSGDGKTLYIVNTDNKEIVVFDTVSDSVTKRLPAANSPIDVAISQRNDYYFVPDFHEGRLYKYRLNDGALTASKYIGTYPTSAVTGTNNNDVFVSRTGDKSNEVVILSGDTLDIKSRLTPGTEPVYLFMDYGALNVYCANFKSQMITRINSITETVYDTYETGLQPYSIAQSPDAKYVFSANFGGANVTMYNTQTSKVVEHFSDGKTPRALSVSTSGRELYVLDYENNALNVYAVRK